MAKLDENVQELPDGQLSCSPKSVEKKEDEGDTRETQEAPGLRKGTLHDQPAQPSSVPASNTQTQSLHNFRRGTGRVLPTKFHPPTGIEDPLDLFCTKKLFDAVVRYVRRDDPTQALIFAGGACFNHEEDNYHSGWSFIAGPIHSQCISAQIEGRLENKGPFGNTGKQNIQRAELRAVLAALTFRYWPGEEFSSIVVATDSEYVVEGATEWIKKWLKNGWRVRQAPVKNRDLWEMLLGELEKLDDGGLAVKFWRIDRARNLEVVDLAGKGAMEPELEVYRQVHGTIIGNFIV